MLTRCDLLFKPAAPLLERFLTGGDELLQADIGIISHLLEVRHPGPDHHSRIWPDGFSRVGEGIVAGDVGGRNEHDPVPAVDQLLSASAMTGVSPVPGGAESILPPEEKRGGTATDRAMASS